MTPFLYILFETHNYLKIYHVNVSKYLHQIQHFTENITLFNALTIAKKHTCITEEPNASAVVH